MLHIEPRKKMISIMVEEWIGVGGHAEGCETPEECPLRKRRKRQDLHLQHIVQRGLITFISDEMSLSLCVCLP